MRVVGCEEGEEGLEGFGGERGVGHAGADGEEVGEGAEGGFEGGYLGGVVADVGLVGGEPVGWEGAVGGWEVEAGGEGGLGGFGGGWGWRRGAGNGEIVGGVGRHDVGGLIQCIRVFALMLRVSSSVLSAKELESRARQGISALPCLNFVSHFDKSPPQVYTNQ